MHLIQIYGRVCRVCCKSDDLCNLNEFNEEYGLTNNEMLNKILLGLPEQSIEFPVPEEICDTCMDQLEISYRFQQLCRATTNKLHKIWQESQLKNEELKLNNHDNRIENEQKMKHTVQQPYDEDLDPIKLEFDNMTECLEQQEKPKQNNRVEINNLDLDVTRTTNDSNSSKQHERRSGNHKNINLYTCTVCSYPNKTKELLRRHKSKCHKKAKDDITDNDDGDYDEDDDENIPLSSLMKNGINISNDCKLGLDEIGDKRNSEGKPSISGISNIDVSSNHCQNCNKSFKYAHYLTKHQCKMIKYSHKCETCSKEFSSANMLQKHRRIKHKAKSSCKAKIKIKAIELPENMQQFQSHPPKTMLDIIENIREPRNDEEANCLRDSDNVMSENEFDEENNDVDYIENENNTLTSTAPTTSPDYTCSECNASFRFEKQLERHTKKHTEAHRFVCIVCNDRFKYPFMLQKHIERHHPEESMQPKVMENKKENLEKSHTCNYCTSAYTNVGGLAQHMSKKHPEIVPFKCDKCDKTFVVEEHLKIHTNRHMGIKNFKCELCDKSFSFKFAMKQHMRIHTGDLNYLCTLCGKKFYRPSNLRQHMQRHGDDKPYTCPHCPKRFKCPSDRYIHLMSHQEGKNHVCSTCGARFSRVDTLHQHQVLHTGEKPYKCDQCPMAFPRLMNLNRHLRTHTGEKPYKCKYCDKSYAQSNDLNKHLRTHVGENTYMCSQCPAAFKYQADLRNHEWEHYRKQKEEEQNRAKAENRISDMEMKGGTSQNEVQ